MSLEIVFVLLGQEKETEIVEIFGSLYPILWRLRIVKTV